MDNCLSCDADNCLKCETNYFIDFNGVCTEDCGSNSFGDLRSLTC